MVANLYDYKNSVITSTIFLSSLTDIIQSVIYNYLFEHLQFVSTVTGDIAVNKEI